MPADARRTDLAEASIDAAVSTNTLEHIDPDDIASILVELRRVLRPGGVCSFAVDYHDHYADSDPTIGPLHFLQFDDPQWRRWNCPFQYQNRLRHPDYVVLFQEAGFVVEGEERTTVERPPGLVLAERFQQYCALDVATVHGWFVLRSPGPEPET